MTPIEKWNIIVEQFNKNKSSQEKDIQALWEDIFSQVFLYSKMLGYLDAQKTYKIGSNGALKPDIILRKNDEPICAVELKQESISLNDKIENQLFSYLKQTKLNIGLIIADKIYLYAYEYNKDDKDQSKIEISFEKDNPDGELFVNLMMYEAFNTTSISEFVNEKICHQNNVQKIKDNLSKNFVIEALQKYLGNNYSIEEINDALNSIEISISDKKKIAIKKVNEPEKKQSDITIKNTQLKWDLDANILIAGGKKSSIYIREYLLKNKYITEDVKTTLAKINKDTKKENKRYWANPSIDFLNFDWLLILNDNVNRKLHIFKLPKDSLSEENVKTRIHDGKTLLDLEIVNKDSEFVCLASKIQFNKWFVESIDY